MCYLAYILSEYSYCLFGRPHVTYIKHKQTITKNMNCNEELLVSDSFDVKAVTPSLQIPLFDLAISQNGSTSTPSLSGALKSHK